MTDRWDFEIKQGETFTRVFTWYEADGVTPRNLTGCTAKMQLKNSFASAAAALVTLQTPEAGSGIVLGGVAGTLTLTITKTQTAALAVTALQGDPPVNLLCHDMFLTWGDGHVDALWEGNATVKKKVTS